VINSLSHLDIVQLIQDGFGVSDEVLVHEVNELVLGRVLYLAVALSFAEGNEFFAIEIIHVNLDLAGHALACHGLTTVAEKVEVFDSTNLLEAMHDALSNEISLLGVSHNANGLIQVAVVSGEMSLDSTVQHLFFLVCNLNIIL
jgi:hypothetical protein